MDSGHEFLEHTADIQVHAWAPSMAALFREIGLVLARVIIEGPDVQLTRDIEVDVEAKDLEALLFDWLTEILYYFDSERLVIGEIVITSLEGSKEAGGYTITSKFQGEPYKHGYHVPGTEVKAITYSYMKLGKEQDGLYHLTIIFDI
nr:archease [Candidatus Sigynarchaeota archaeon]